VYGKIMQSTKRERDMIFYVETFNWEKPRGGGEFTIIYRLQKLQKLYVRVSVLGLTGRREGPKVFLRSPSHWRRMFIYA